MIEHYPKENHTVFHLTNGYRVHLRYNLSPDGDWTAEVRTIHEDTHFDHTEEFESAHYFFAWLGGLQCSDPYDTTDCACGENGADKK